MAEVANESRQAEDDCPLSPEELKEAEESLEVYCKPVELYNILLRRQFRNPYFLQRCLDYKMQEKDKSLRDGLVIFKYKYYRNMLHKTEVTEDFSCAFCLIRCASFKGLECHLSASHDHFDYECWANEAFRVVIVYPKTDICTSDDIVGYKVNPRSQPFFFCRKPFMRRGLDEDENHVGPLAMVPYVPGTPSGSRGVPEHMECEPYDPNAVGGSSTVGVIIATPESDAQTTTESGNTLVAPLQVALSRQLTINELPGPENRSLLEKRRFYHSHTAKPMTLEEVYAEEDSEGEIDDDVAEVEDRWMLDDFVDVTQEEKQLMHLWNSFIRKQRVLADGHIPWACEAFSHLYGKDLLHIPQLHRCWGSMLVKLWTHGLIDAKTVNNCQNIVKHIA